MRSADSKLNTNIHAHARTLTYSHAHTHAHTYTHAPQQPLAAHLGREVLVLGLQAAANLGAKGVQLFHAAGHNLPAARDGLRTRRGQRAGACWCVSGLPAGGHSATAQQGLVVGRCQGEAHVGNGGKGP